MHKPGNIKKSIVFFILLVASMAALSSGIWGEQNQQVLAVKDKRRHQPGLI